MEETLEDIGMNTRNLVVHMECDYEASCLSFIEEVNPTQSVDKWVYSITSTWSGEEAPSIYWLISLFPDTNNNNRYSDSYINSWKQTGKALK